MKKTAVDLYIVEPVSKFIKRQTSAGLVLMGSAILAMVLANSPLSDYYHAFWQKKITVGFDQFILSKTLLHWINDGLMAVFFFVIGLELKREILAGELAKPKEALLPIVAGLGGMVVPAAIFLSLNAGTEYARGWGIPMATDIAFALGVLYMLGNRVPLSLKVFLTALAIVDDIGAILVVAFFYTSEISFLSLGVGALFLVVLVAANMLGVRNTYFFGIIGIGGLWLAFLMSGIHATIAAVLAAFTIPTNVRVNTRLFSRKMRISLSRFNKLHCIDEENNGCFMGKEQLEMMDNFRHLSKETQPPLQRLEHTMHGFVGFFVLPVFALANAGVTVTSDLFAYVTSTLSLGIILGLVLGKFIGIVAFTRLVVYLKWTSLPAKVTWRHIYGVSLLAGVGFTMSLFITELAFTSEAMINQAKLAILIASAIAGTVGYKLLNDVPVKKEKPEKQLVQVA